MSTYEFLFNSIYILLIYLFNGYLFASWGGGGDGGGGDVGGGWGGVVVFVVVCGGGCSGSGHVCIMTSLYVYGRQVVYATDF